MFAPCLLFLFFFGSINADDSLHCYFDGGSFCGWSNDPQAINTWNASLYDFISTGLFEMNEPARLLSPMYDRSLEAAGCFSMRYTTNVDQNMKSPTLRIYQRPENLKLENLIQSSDDAKQNYLLFEIKADLDRTFYNAVLTLEKFDSNFQIIIEAVSSSFYAFVAIDNVALLQGSECASARTSARTPVSPSYNIDKYYVRSAAADQSSSGNTAITASP